MKKAISLVLVAVMVLALGGCAADNGGQALYEKYAPIIDMLEAKDYQGAIRDITAMAIEEQRGEVEEVPIIQILCGSTWYTNYEDAPKEITFSEDGTCTIGGETMTWLAEESGSDTYLNLQISKDGKICRYASINTGNKVPNMGLSYAEERDGGIYSGEGIGTYYNHPLMPYLLRTWYDLSEYETVNGVENFYFNNSSASVNGDSCDWTLTDSESKDTLVAHIDAKNEREGAYTVTLTMRDGHPVVTFTDDATGETGLYYNGNGDGYEKTWPEVVYAEAMENYTDYLENGSFYCNISETNYSDREDTANDYLYNQFVSVGDYKDAAQIVENWNDVRFNRAMRLLNSYLNDYGFYVGETYYRPSENALPYLYTQFGELSGYAEADAILERFTIVEDVFLKATYESTDNMGNVSSNNTDEVQEYNELGQVVYYSGYTKLNRLYGNSYGAYYLYDEAGRVSGINLGYTDTVYVQIKPTYDDQGNKISEHVVNNSGEFDVTYAYDDQNRLAEIRRPYSSSYDPETYYYSWTFVYDDAGKLVAEKYIEIYNGRLDEEYVYSYTYDGAGNMIAETETYYYYNYDGTVYYTYTHTADCVCDDQGRVIQKNWTYGNTVYSSGTENKPSKASSVYTYTYGDVYFFDATGMEPTE